MNTTSSRIFYASQKPSGFVYTVIRATLLQNWLHCGSLGFTRFTISAHLDCTSIFWDGSRVQFLWGAAGHWEFGTVDLFFEQSRNKSSSKGCGPIISLTSNTKVFRSERYFTFDPRPNPLFMQVRNNLEGL